MSFIHKGFTKHAKWKNKCPILVNISLVVETFNPEKNGREAYFIPLQTSFFIEKHIQNPLESPVGKSFYGCPRFCITPIIPIIMTNHFVIGIIQRQLLMICHNLLPTT